MRYERVEDILRLALIMQDSFQGVSIQDIQDEFEISRRTAIRMKDAVERLFPDMEEVQNYSSRIKKWRLSKTPLPKMVSFTAEELAELENCKSLVKTLNYTNRTDLLSEIIAKINVLNSSKSVKTDIEALLEVEGYAVRQFPRYKIQSEILNIVSEALKAFKIIEFDYTDKEGIEKQVKAEPYGIIYGEKTYLLAKVDGQFKYYLLHKLKNIKILDDYFDKDENFDLKKYLHKSFGIYQEKEFGVKLLFSSEVKDAIKDYNLHPTQKMKVNPDGTTTVKFKAGGKYEICWHLFKWGDKVKILAPKELKDVYKSLLADGEKAIGK